MLACAYIGSGVDPFAFEISTHGLSAVLPSTDPGGDARGPGCPIACRNIDSAPATAVADYRAVVGQATPTDDERDGFGGALRRRIQLFGVAVVAVVVVGVVGELDEIGTRAELVLVWVILIGGTAGWLAELFTPPRWPHLELALLVAIGFAGSALNALAPDSTGFVLAYLAISGLGMRFTIPHAIVATFLVVAAIDIGILLTSTHPTTWILSTDAGAFFVLAMAVSTRSAQFARRESERLLAELEATRSAQSRAAALAERAHLAREMHDILAHTLAGLVLSLDGLRLLAKRVGADPRLTEEVVRSGRLARSGMADTRRAIGALRGESVSGPELLAALVEGASALDVQARLSVSGTPRKLDTEAELTLYRTAQEALTNTAKYAGSGATFQLDLIWGGDQVELVATDNAVDDVPRALPSGKFGLAGLRERAELAGGTLLVGRTADGFRVHLRLPYPANPVVRAPLEALVDGSTR